MQPQISVSRVYGDALRGVKARAGFWLLSAVLLSIVGALSVRVGVTPPRVVPTVQAATGVAPPADAGIELAHFVLQVLVPCFIGVVMLRLTIASLEGERMGLWLALRQSLMRALPLAVLAMIIAVFCGVGFALLLVPGIMLWCRWAIAWPALTAEGGSPVTALRRSATLTKGHRWDVFFVYLLQAVFFFMAGLVTVLGITVLLAETYDRWGFLVWMAAAVVSLVLGYVGVIMAIVSTSASLYVNLKRIAA
ncbi:hypothetical protein IAI18_09720 [Acetobacteraceae bacterium H6797]|nr:hypothetical protein [Acetobacteraceae bacterium H6797]